MKALIDGVWCGDIADTPALRARRVGLVNPAIVPLGPAVAFA